MGLGKAIFLILHVAAVSKGYLDDFLFGHCFIGLFLILFFVISELGVMILAISRAFHTYASAVGIALAELV